jgi:transcription elongation factor Elf1
MVVRRTCPHCGKVGYIRAERVIKAGSARTEFFCGACEHTWTELEEPTERSEERGGAD